MLSALADEGLELLCVESKFKCLKELLKLVLLLPLLFSFYSELRKNMNILLGLAEVHSSIKGIILNHVLMIESEYRSEYYSLLTVLKCFLIPYSGKTSANLNIERGSFRNLDSSV